MCGDADPNRGFGVVSAMTVGEAREYLDAHERDGDPEVVRACEALVDATPHLADFAKAPAEQLEERGAD